jgi:hypothetical protein
VRTPLTLVTPGKTVTIARGNWTATSLATYLDTELDSEGIAVTYDPTFLGFTFSPGMDIDAGTTAQNILGFPTGFTGSVITSEIPINLMGPSRIHVNTSLSMYTVPLSGRLATIPISTTYGGYMSYRDLDGQQPMMVTSSDFHSLVITLTDENNVTLEGYEDIPWGVVLSVEVIRDQGYVNPGLGHGVGQSVMHPIQRQQFYQSQA